MAERRKAKKEARRAAARDVKNDVGRLQKEINKLRDHQNRALEIRNKAAYRLDDASRSALAYVAGVLDPWKHGSGVRLPADGLYPTAVCGSFTRFSLAMPAPVTNKVTGGIVVFPDIKYQYQYISSHTSWDSGWTWSANQSGSGYAAMSSNAAFFRGCLNMGVRFSNKAPVLKRGGRLLVGLLPPGAVVPTAITNVYASARTAVFDLAKVPDEFNMVWFPAMGEAVSFYGPASITRTASTWTAVSATDIVYGDPAIIMLWQTDDTAEVSIDIDVEITLNTEFIPGNGSPQQLFPGKVVPGGEADVNKFLKPVEMSVRSPSVMQQIGEGVMDFVSQGGNVLSDIGSKTKNPMFSAAGKALGGLASGGRKMMQGDFSGGVVDYLGGLGWGAISIFGERDHKRHAVSAALECPELDPYCNYGEHKTGDKPTMYAGREDITDEVWERRLIAVLQRRMEDRKDGLPVTPVPNVQLGGSERKAQSGWYQVSA